MKTSRRIHLAVFLFSTLVTSVAPSAFAQAYPNKTLHFITVSVAGNDIVTRVYADQVSAQIGHPVVVDNRPGGSGMIGAEAGAKAAPDGYSLLFATSGTMTINQFVIARVPYDTLKDFVPIALVASDASALVVNPQATAARNMKELVELAKAQPGKLSYGSFGTGSLPSLMVAIIAKSQGLQLIHVPYKGSADAYNDIMAGRLTMMLDPVRNALPFIKSGKFVALAASMKSQMLPQIPTIQELGLASFDSRTWWGVYAPAATPGPIAQRLVAEFERAVVAPAVKERLGALGIDLASLTGDRFAAFQIAEINRWRDTIKDLGVKPE
ncbi:MAG: tripartite tricarboxylate transporter substrate binding protein [Betaproteobacteria bacterium]|nr:tripartite tricarboxylate transporter substrate binding protein [Betaproteobacteria bacterium]